MYELKKNGKVLTSKSVGTGPSSYEKRIYRAAVSQRLRNTALEGQHADVATDRAWLVFLWSRRLPEDGTLVSKHVAV